MSSPLSQTWAQTRARVPQWRDLARERARLSLVPGTTRAPRVPFAAFILTVLGLGLVALLVLNTTLQHQAFAAHALSERADSLALERQQLQLEVDQLRSPEHLAAEAQRLGMVQNTDPAFLMLADGSIRGEAAPAQPGQRLQLAPPPPVNKAKLAKQKKEKQQRAEEKKRAAEKQRAEERQQAQRTDQQKKDRQQRDQQQRDQQQRDQQQGQRQNRDTQPQSTGGDGRAG